MPSGITLLDVINSTAAVVAAIGVVAAFGQLWLTRRQARATYEDAFVDHYRGLLQELPVEALLGEALSEASQCSHLGPFFRYFDLSNEQAFLFGRHRISTPTWKDWEQGICQNLQRPAFAAAWEEISRRDPRSFGDLRAVLHACGVHEPSSLAAPQERRINGH